MNNHKAMPGVASALVKERNAKGQIKVEYPWLDESLRSDWVCARTSPERLTICARASGWPDNRPRSSRAAIASPLRVSRMAGSAAVIPIRAVSVSVWPDFRRAILQRRTACSRSNG